MRILRIDGTETDADLIEAILSLRAKRVAAAIPSTAAEYAAAIDELLDRLASDIPKEATC